jgi:hypothetical protein
MRKLSVLTTLVFVVSLWSFAAAVNYGDITVTEIMQNPDAVYDDDGEWFEVYNKSADAINLNGWTVRDDGTDSFVIDGDLVVEAGEYAVLGRNGDPAVNGGVEVDYEYGGAMYLGNSADELILEDADLIEVARVEYDGGTNWPDPTGASMNLMNFNWEMNNPEYWFEASVTTYGDGDFGTPGAKLEPYFELELKDVPASVNKGDLVNFDVCLTQPTPYRTRAKVWLAAEKEPIYYVIDEVSAPIPPDFGICKPTQVKVPGVAPAGIWILGVYVGPQQAGFDEIWYSYSVEVEVLE